eukprot:8822330-Pyramimonas_sp.AAC.1
MMVSSLTEVELHPRFRALLHINREGIMRRASLKYLDAWIWSVLSTEAEQLSARYLIVSRPLKSVFYQRSG